MQNIKDAIVKQFLLYSLICFSALKLSAQHHQLDWVNVPYIEDGQTQWIDDMTIDSSGNIYTFQNKHTYSQFFTGMNYFKGIVKQDHWGNVVWQKQLGNLWLPEENLRQVLLEKNGYLYTIIYEYNVFSVFKINELTGDADTILTQSVISPPDSIFGVIGPDYNAGIVEGLNGHIYAYIDVNDNAKTTSIYEIDNNALLHTYSLNSIPNYLRIDNFCPDNSGNIYVGYTANLAGTAQYHLRRINNDGTFSRDTTISAATNTQLFAIDSGGNCYWSNNSVVIKSDSQFHVLWTYGVANFDPWEVKMDAQNNVYIDFSGTYVPGSKIVKIKQDGTVAYTHPISQGLAEFDFLNISKEGYAIVSGLNFMGVDNNSSVSHKQAIILTVLDSLGGLKDFYKDTIFYTMSLVGLYWRNCVNSKGDIFYGASFTNVAALPYQNSNTPITMKNDLWYSIKLCQKCGANNVTGKVVIDTIMNCAVDSLEPVAHNTLVYLSPGTRVALVNSNGSYNFNNVPDSNYTITVMPPPYLRTDCDSVYAFTIDSSTPTAQRNFALKPEQGCKMFVSINGTRAQCGFIQQTDVTYYNEMFQPAEGMVAVTLDTLFFFDHATVPPDSVDGQTYFWKFNQLSPFTEKTVSIYSAVAILQIFQALNFNVSVAVYPRCMPAGNPVAVDSFSDVVWSSFDPNDKDVFPLQIRKYNQFTDKHAPLTFQINFQNTGNDTAFRIVVRDTIDNNFDISSLKLLGTSHLCKFEMGNNRDITWTFDNIQLLDSSANEPKSHGYIKYSITPKSSLAIGEYVKNKAFIYFDFNNPVITNNVALMYVKEFYNSINPILQDENSFKIYPNPASNQLFVETTGEKVIEINIYNTTGSLIGQVLQSQNVIDISHLANGVYIAEIKTAGVSVKKRWVKM